MLIKNITIYILKNKKISKKKPLPNFYTKGFVFFKMETSESSSLGITPKPSIISCNIFSIFVYQDSHQYRYNCIFYEHDLPNLHYQN